jgi:hypothetical protein
MYKFPVCTLFHQYCAARIAEEDGDPVEWDGIVLTNLIKPLEEKGYEIDSYNYEVLMGFLYDYIAATLEKGDK